MPSITDRSPAIDASERRVRAPENPVSEQLESRSEIHKHCIDVVGVQTGGLRDVDDGFVLERGLIGGMQKFQDRVEQFSAFRLSHPRSWRLHRLFPANPIDPLDHFIPMLFHPIFQPSRTRLAGRHSSGVTDQMVLPGVGNQGTVRRKRFMRTPASPAYGGSHAFSEPADPELEFLDSEVLDRFAELAGAEWSRLLFEAAFAAGETGRSVR